jgi:cation diffusion facilitator family transporter
LETLAAVFIGLVLVVVGGGMVYYAAGKIASKQVKLPTDSVAAIAFFSVIVKELVYRFARNAAVRIKSSMVYANAWHHRSDVLSSIAVIAGWAAGRLGFAYADPIAAIVVGVMIIFVAVEILTKSFAELTEASVDRQTRKQIEDVLNSYPAVNKWHKLRTRLVGREIFFDLHILVDPDLNIKQAHEVSERLENTLHEQIPQPINITIHIEPDIPELRI